MSGPAVPAGSVPPLPPGRQTAPGDLVGLLARAAHGDQPAVAALYRRTVTQVLGLANLMLGDTAAAEAVTAAVYQQLPRTAAHYDPVQGSAEAWLLSMAHRQAVGHLRTRRDSTAPPSGSADGGPSPVPRVPLPAALERLDASSRELILLVYYRGYTVAQAASLLGLPAANARSRLLASLCAVSAAAGPDRWPQGDDSW
jgi:RNA polymerase sigma-70 factor, ECF subfamily